MAVPSDFKALENVPKSNRFVGVDFDNFYFLIFRRYFQVDFFKTWFLHLIQITLERRVELMTVTEIPHQQGIQALWNLLQQR